MKKLSVITAALVLFAGISFAQQSGTMPASKKASGQPSKGNGAASSTPATPVKKVPNSKTTKAVPTTKQPAAGTTK